MASVAEKKRLRDAAYQDLAKVSAYDQVSGMLIALLLMVGTAVLVLFIIYVTTRSWKTHVAIPVIIEPEYGRGEHALGSAQDLEAPGLEELEEILEPEIDANTEALTEAINDQMASLDQLDSLANVSDQGIGKGDNRPEGPDGSGANIIPRWERWKIEYAASDIKTYSKQLDFFKIELGVAGGDDQIVYASGFSKTPKLRKGTTTSEDRLYFTWKSGSLRQADLELLKRAGVDTAGRFPIQFYPADTENLLAYVEKQFMGRRELETVKETVFSVKPDGNGYTFAVIRQNYRTPL